MPVKFYDDYGIVLEFGQGDLAPAGLTSRLHDDKLNTLGFVVIEPHKVGDLVEIKINKAKLAPVFLTFHKVESIDIVIEKLMEIRQSMTTMEKETNATVVNSSTDSEEQSTG
jgi:hypothetical protein